MKLPEPAVVAQVAVGALGDDAVRLEALKDDKVTVTRAVFVKTKSAVTNPRRASAAMSVIARRMTVAMTVVMAFA